MNLQGGYLGRLLVCFIIDFFLIKTEKNKGIFRHLWKELIMTNWLEIKCSELFDFCSILCCYSKINYHADYLTYSDNVENTQSWEHVVKMSKLK